MKIENTQIQFLNDVFAPIAVFGSEDIANVVQQQLENSLSVAKFGPIHQTPQDLLLVKAI